MNKKLQILLILFTISKTFFICLISFVCGYCVGYYFYDFYFYNCFQIIKENMGSLTQLLQKLNTNHEHCSGDILSNEIDF